MKDFIESQLAIWPEAAERYHKLGKTQRRKYKLGDYVGFFQFNPARINSTGAKIDKDSIEKRPCFLCEKNRPEVQKGISLLNRWDLLVNPFPIFPIHFTIVSKEHMPQSAPPLDMVVFADSYPELAIFFNGEKAGASAPDHLHLQAVLSSELPLLAIVEKAFPSNNSELLNKILESSQSGLDLPFLFLTAIIGPGKSGMETLMQLLSFTGGDKEGKPDPGLRNLIVWKDRAGFLRVILIPRKAHRPNNYGTGPNNFLVSPGTIDLTGIIILPREEDFNRIQEMDLKSIFSDVVFTPIQQG